MLRTVKSAIVFLIALSSGMGWALTPKVGESVTMAVMVTSQGSAQITAGPKIVKEIVGVEGNQVKVKTTLKMVKDGEVITVEGDAELMPLHQLNPYQQIMQELAFCEANGGTLTKVKVPAGEFETCHVVAEVKEEGINSIVEVWLGLVPFGIVKVKETDHITNSVSEIVLESYQQ